MSNINRDYLIVLDAKSSEITQSDDLIFYVTDEHTANIFVNLVVPESHENLRQYVEVHDPEKYSIEMHIVDPTNDYMVVEGELISREDSLWQLKVPNKFSGSYKCEIRTHYNNGSIVPITTSNKIKYKVKKSIANDLDNIVDAPEYPVVIRLLNKLSDIELYEDERRTNELARQLAEQQRQVRYDELAENMEGRITSMDNKITEVEDRVVVKEQAVDKLIVDTKKDINDYKVAKDTEIDEYKTAKDTEINQAITNQNNKIDDAIANQNNKIDTAVAEQNNRITTVENNDNTQNTRLDALEAKDIAHETSITNIEAKNVEQDNRLDSIENINQQQAGRLDSIEAINTTQNNRLDSIEAVNVSQGTRLDAIEVKNQQQDDRLLDIEKVNKRQDMDLKCLFAESKNNMIDVTEEGNSIYLQNSTVGYTLIDEIQGNTMVNCNKEPDKEIILNGNINTEGYSNVTLTEGVNGGLVDVALEGNTMVNVCDQKDPVAITKSYTVETGNHVALQGEYDGKCRPVVTGNTLVNLIGTLFTINNNPSYATMDEYGVITNKVYKTSYNHIGLVNVSKFKPSTTYTVITDVIENNIAVVDNTYTGAVITHNIINGITCSAIPPYTLDYNLGETGIRVSKFTTPADLSSYGSGNLKFLASPYGKCEGSYKLKAMILEGDYTDKQIPDYFEGLQSSFEDKVVTQEMVDAGEELAENLGKYKVEYKATGKNLFKFGSAINGGVITLQNTDRTPILKAGTYVISSSCEKIYTKPPAIALYDTKGKITTIINIISGSTFSVKNDIVTSYLYCNGPNYSESKGKDYPFTNIQIEEGDTATSYEPYKEHTKTLYLNSPLLEGDTIEQQGDNVVHVHRSELRSYETDDELTLPTDMTNTLVAKATPQYEVISQNDTILCDSYVNGHLDFDSVVPIEKVDFLPFTDKLTYLYPSTQYAVQFVSDAVSKVDITLGGAKLLNQNVVIGTNKYMIATPSKLVHNNLELNGEGFNASNIVVTEATDQDFGYFEGMKSVGECEDLEVVSSNSDNTLSTTQTLTHEPLRAVGDTKDKYVLIDGKWHIERNCGYRNNYSICDAWSNENLTNRRLKLFKLDNSIEEFDDMSALRKVKSNKFKCVQYGYMDGRFNVPFLAYITENGNLWVSADINYTQQDMLNYIKDCQFVYELPSPTYEPIDYNPFTVYSEVTHISNNSTIPCNMAIKNTGYNCLLKPNTTYTVSSNLGLNTVTTPSTLTEDCLRFYDTDTSTVTTMNNVTILEGNYTTGKPIPSHFSGIESAFEQEYDEAVGKYKVKIRVQNEDASKENYIEFYINEPLRGIGDVKDKVYVKNDKVVVERNCGQREYQDGDFGTYLTDKVNTVYQLAEPIYEEVEYNDVKLFIESFKNSTLFYNSNIPVTSKVWYSFSIPIVEEVAALSARTDNQEAAYASILDEEVNK